MLFPLLHNQVHLDAISCTQRLSFIAYFMLGCNEKAYCKASSSLQVKYGNEQNDAG